MSEWNSCSKLLAEDALKKATEEYKNSLMNRKNPFEVMLNLQKSLQEKLYQKYPGRSPNVNNLETIGNKYDFLRDQKEAFDDEYRELIDALPGMNKPDKERSALWKKWKADHVNMGNVVFNDLTFDEQVEAKMEMIDMFHFVLNMFIGMDMSAEDVFIYYYLKNAENFERQERDY